MNRKGFSILIVLVLAALLIVIGAIVVFNLKQKGGVSVPVGNKEVSQSQERKFVAIGASTTKANNLSSDLVGDNPEYSFATGTKVESLYLFLKNKGEELEPKNLAESGANSQKVLLQQVPNVVSFHPKYVTIDIMADIFEGERPVKLKENLSEIVKKIKDQDTVILIGTYPNLTLMRKASFPSCSEDKLHLGIDKVTEEKIKLFNQAIEEVASEYDLILVDNFNTLGASDVSDYDCLHPSIEGQKKLARAWIGALEKRR